MNRSLVRPRIKLIKRCTYDNSKLNNGLIMKAQVYSTISRLSTKKRALK